MSLIEPPPTIAFTTLASVAMSYSDDFLLDSTVLFEDLAAFLTNECDLSVGERDRFGLPIYFCDEFHCHLSTLNDAEDTPIGCVLVLPQWIPFTLPPTPWRRQRAYRQPGRCSDHSSMCLSRSFRWLEEDGKLHIHYDPGTRYGYSGEGFVRGDGLSPASRAEMMRPQVAITSVHQFPTLVPDTNPANASIGLAAGLGLVTFQDACHEARPRRIP